MRATRPRILVTRTDRLGDVMMSLSALESLRLTFPDSPISFLAQPAIVDAIQPYLNSREIQAVDSVLKDFDAALFLFAETVLLRNAKREGIPLRVGQYSKPWSFWLLTHGKRQRRSLARYNEAEYGLELSEVLAKQFGKSLSPLGSNKIEIPKGEGEVAIAQEVLGGVRGDFAVLHPGMSGSALNLSAENYVGLIDTVIKKTGFAVILSEGPAAQDRELVAKIIAKRPELVVVRGVSLGVLREVFRLSRLVIAPSTGPLHLAHYVGAQTIGLYSPVLSQSKARWAPWGGTGKSFVFSPRVDCPGKRECLGERCPHFSCMEREDWVGLLLKDDGWTTAF